MERHVKERLVGAAVLMAAAIILIPEMLSGPDRSEHEQATAREPSETGLKTYSIDLNNPPGANAQSVPDDRAPPPEETSAPQALAQTTPAQPQHTEPVPAKEPEANPETAAETVPTQPSARVTSSSPGTPSAKREADRTASPPARQAPETQRPVESPSRPLASAPGVPTSRGWAVQLGSFSSVASAERLAGEFRGSHDDVFVMPVKSGSTTLYRVRIGPMKDRAAAEETLRRVRTKVSGAAVVAHP